VYGDVYAGAAASLTAALVLAAGFQAMTVIVWSTLVGAGRPWSGLAMQSAGQLALVTVTAVLVPALGLTGVAVAAIVAAVATAALGLTLVCAELGVRFAAVRSGLTVAVLGWLGAAALWTAGATGWLEAVALAAAVVMLQFQRLTPDERRWVLARVRRPAAEAVR